MGTYQFDTSKPVQYNASTLKAMYNNVTGKVQVTPCILQTRISAVVADVVKAGCESVHEDFNWPSDPNGTYGNFVFHFDLANGCFYKDETSKTDWVALLVYVKSSGHWALTIRGNTLIDSGGDEHYAAVYTAFGWSFPSYSQMTNVNPRNNQMTIPPGCDDIRITTEEADEDYWQTGGNGSMTLTIS